MDNYQSKPISEVENIKAELRTQGWHELALYPGMTAKDTAKYIVESKTQSCYAKMGVKWV